MQTENLPASVDSPVPSIQNNLHTSVADSNPFIAHTQISQTQLFWWKEGSKQKRKGWIMIIYVSGDEWILGIFITLKIPTFSVSFLTVCGSRFKLYSKFNQEHCKFCVNQSRVVCACPECSSRALDKLHWFFYAELYSKSPRFWESIEGKLGEESKAREESHDPGWEDFTALKAVICQLPHK